MVTTIAMQPFNTVWPPALLPIAAHHPRQTEIKTRKSQQSGRRNKRRTKATTRQLVCSHNYEYAQPSCAATLARLFIYFSLFQQKPNESLCTHCGPIVLTRHGTVE